MNSDEIGRFFYISGLFQGLGRMRVGRLFFFGIDQLIICGDAEQFAYAPGLRDATSRAMRRVSVEDLRNSA